MGQCMTVASSKLTLCFRLRLKWVKHIDMVSYIGGCRPVNSDIWILIDTKLVIYVPTFAKFFWVASTYEALERA